MNCVSLFQVWPSILMPGSIAALIGWAMLTILVSLLIGYLVEDRDGNLAFFIHGMSIVTAVCAGCFIMLALVVLSTSSLIYTFASTICYL